MLSIQIKANKKFIAYSILLGWIFVNAAVVQHSFTKEHFASDYTHLCPYQSVSSNKACLHADIFHLTPSHEKFLLLEDEYIDPDIISYSDYYYQRAPPSQFLI